MSERPRRELVLENRHTGERLVIRRRTSGGDTWFELQGSLPPRREGPPPHVHFAEDEEGRVTRGRLSVEVAGRRDTLGSGESTRIPRGVVHRWWNEGAEPLESEGVARPAADLDRYLQAIFAIMNAGPPGRPPLFYMAHAALRHRDTQAVRLMPGPLQALLFRVVLVVGTLLGKYRGDDWPGCPARCPGVPAGGDE